MLSSIPPNELSQIKVNQILLVHLQPRQYAQQLLRQLSYPSRPYPLQHPQLNRKTQLNREARWVHRTQTPQRKQLSLLRQVQDVLKYTQVLGLLLFLLLQYQIHQVKALLHVSTYIYITN